jgi:hypothetical protein
MTQGERRYWELIEPLFDIVDIDSPEAFFASIQGLNPLTVNLFAAHFCLSEVHNGGFLQFFLNSTGILAQGAIEGLRAIGMPQLAAVVAEASALLGSPYPRDRNERREALLAASGRSEAELQAIFKEASNSYLAFVKATKPFNFKVLNAKAWQLAEEENGDFGNAATACAHAVGLFQ